MTENDYRVVTADIPLGDPGRGVFAYRVGHQVPAADVKANGWDDYVATPSSKAGKAAAAGATSEGGN